MLKNRLCYLFIFLCAGVFFICFNGYYSMYVFLLALALPWLSLLISLPGMLTLRVTACVPGNAQPAHTAKNQPVSLHVAVANRSFLPSGRARATLTIENSFTAERRVEKLEFSPARQPQILEHKLSCATCGVVHCRLSKARAYDLLGLFWLPVRTRNHSGCQVVVQPTLFHPTLGLDPQQSQQGEDERYSLTHPGGDPTELFGLRAYRPGDRLSRVDWKLSQKTDSLLVKEASRPLATHSLLLIDLGCTGLEADTLMDALATLAGFLAGQGVGLLIGFLRDGHLSLLEAGTPEDVTLALEAVLRHAGHQPLPDTAVLSCPAGVCRAVCLSCRPGSGLTGGLCQRYPAVRLHLVSLYPPGPKTSLPPQVRWVRVRPGHLSQDLSGLLL